jgi:ribosomal protein L37AE/L43A
MEKILKQVCPKCGSSYMTQRGNESWKCNGCGDVVNFDAAQQKMHLTAFGRRLAWLFFGFVLVLAMVIIIIGGK